MTGFNSKRNMAQDKVQEEMQAVFTKRQAERDKLQDEPDMLLIVYQRGFSDGKQAAQRPWAGLTDEDWAAIGDMPDTFDQGVAWAQARLKERNNG